jgi:hypothetical protein
MFSLKYPMYNLAFIMALAINMSYSEKIDFINYLRLTSKITMVHYLYTLYKFPIHQKLLLMEACLVLLLTRFMLKLVSFQKFAERLGQVHAETSEHITPEKLQILKGIAWAIQTSVEHLPINLLCFPQSITACLMLKRRHIPSTIYIGVKLDAEGDNFAAHSWLRAGSQIVTGGDIAKEYTVLTSIATTTKDANQ